MIFICAVSYCLIGFYVTATLLRAEIVPLSYYPAWGIFVSILLVTLMWPAILIFETIESDKYDM